MDKLYNKKETEQEIQRGFDFANEEWKRKALEEVHNVCLRQKRFTADDIRMVVTDDVVQTHDRRAMGGIMKRAQNNGWCKATGIHIKSKFTHGHLHQVWESLLLE